MVYWRLVVEGDLRGQGVPEWSRVSVEVVWVLKRDSRRVTFWGKWGRCETWVFADQGLTTNRPGK
ncbi:Hypothetical protein [Corynebacterium glutamicum ATCC 13032]|uniref:Uncharacterized protein n=1 Tax=Corynebacterium glutamicum (strain ATCC 13032 / DSM 20300 / JCM 1318 / BCRC 11384 / CCUG 27702 / LMG 3730 / NBRC 12168 / NCIMB 10025 / NRRL B-2784 / 534) TaxID=196627 RepID=Q8NRA6_CORGL|nr:Hypothetical protein [Corynebacterium glutamicum ATCC 13032]